MTALSAGVLVAVACGAGSGLAALLDALDQRRADERIQKWTPRDGK